jgi:hypothetical protein
VRVRVVAALVAFGLAGCATAQTASAPADVLATQAIADAVKLVRAGRLDEAERRLSTARATVATDHRRLEQIDYYLASVFVLRGKVDDAHALIELHAQEAALRGDPESIAWMGSSLAWLLWWRGDLAGAVTAIDQAAAAMPALDGVARGQWSAKIDWERAVFLVDRAWAAPPEERADLVRGADQARAALTGLPEDRQKALSAYAALRAGDVETAVRLARAVPLDEESDAAVIWAVATSLEAGGDAAAAAGVRRHGKRTVGLIAPLLERPRPR